MTTMLRSAAMTLLSKTLLTFLYKYLSDVDVEGIEMPSLYGSAEGQGSGWGVRLSNVKLREGAELKTLPGSKKSKPKQPKEKGKEKSPIPKGEDDNDNIQVPIPPEPDGSNKDSGSQETKKGGKNGTTKAEANTFRDGGQNGDSAPEGQKEKEAYAASVANDGGGKDGVPPTGRKRSDSEYTFEDDDSLSSLPGSGETRPETPTQDSSISFLSCFAPGSEDAKRQAIAKAARQTQLADQNRHHQEQEVDTKSQEEGNGPENARAPKMNGHFKPVSSGDEYLDDTVCKVLDDEFPGNDNGPKGVHEGGDQESSADEDDDGHSQPMILRIGKGGYIGTLDVRLVGRELHVLVEDAFLTLEVVRKPLPSEDQSPMDDEKSTADPAPPEPAEKKATPPVAPINIEDLKTAGERVLASNPIARIFSSIPHLFLRDILVRLVVKDESGEDDTKHADKDTTNISADDEEEIESAEVVVDLGIGLLSCTDGEDFLSPFYNDENLSEDGGSVPPILKTQTSQSWSVPENEYLERRIRTGKGSDGGIWLNIVTPKSDKSHSHKAFNRNYQEMTPDTSPRWARQTWLEATHYCMLRSSGLDIQARIFLGTKKELAQVNSSYFLSDAEAFQDIDSTLFGFDHVVPGPTPNLLPPLAPPMSTRSYDEADDFGNVRSQVYKADRNGIQSSNIASCFYRVARGMTPTRCTLEHLPCEDCEKCWEASCERTSEPVDATHPLDSVTPLPGLALSISFRDPLEINLDRISLDGLGLVIGLFKKPAEPPDQPVEDQKPTSISGPEDYPVKTENPKTTPKSSGSYFSSFFYGSSQVDEAPQKQQSLPPAFPTYMKPENIQILGVHAVDVRFRVHVMRPDDEERHNTGLSFCYWDARVECLTFDQQKLTSDEKVFQDMRMDAAIVEMKEFKGTEQKIMLSSGIPYPKMEAEKLPVSSVCSFGNSKRPPWPTTACALLDVQSSFESQLYESRERHGLQLRMLQVTEKPGKATEKARSLINCQMGPAEICLPWPVAAPFREVKDEISKSLFPVQEEADTEEATVVDASTDTVKQYRFQFGGGRVALGKMMNVQMPLTRLAGDICPESGFSMETLVERAELSYGTSSEKLAPTANTAKGFSLRRLTTLPENVRLRILLFVDNLEPMERALQVKRQSNSFLRCTAVNKGLGKIAPKKMRKKAASAPENSVNRRQELMNNLLTLDDDTLESLWTHHQKKQRKVKKKAAR